MRIIVHITILYIKRTYKKIGKQEMNKQIKFKNKDFSKLKKLLFKN